jgi:hypothetical protein
LRSPATSPSSTDRDRGKNDWLLADVHDTEAFLGILLRRRKRRLAVLLQYFRVARECKAILADHTWGLTAREPCGSTGQIVPLGKQRQLFHRWVARQGSYPYKAGEPGWLAI